jgi:hypothetical protein
MKSLLFLFSRGAFAVKSKSSEDARLFGRSHHPINWVFQLFRLNVTLECDNFKPPILLGSSSLRTTTRGLDLYFAFIFMNKIKTNYKNAKE